MHRVVKSYVDAFNEVLQDEAIDELLDKKALIKLCFENQDFLEVLKNPFVEEKKFDFVLSLLEIQNQNLKNALFLLAKTKRLIFLGEIVRGIQRTLDARNKRCHGVLFSLEKNNFSLVALFKKELESKIGYEVQLDEKQWNQDGVKCCIDDLNLEISFSQKEFIASLSNVILSSISERSVN